MEQLLAGWSFWLLALAAVELFTGRPRRRMLLLAPLLIVAASCAPRHPAPMPPTAAALVVTPFCVPMLVVDGDVEVVARVCLDSSWACGRVRAAADRWGYLADIVEVGVCIHETGRSVETGP